MAARLVRERGRLMQAAAPAGVGAMAAVLGAEDALVAVCREVSSDHVVVPANYNSPGQIVIGGHAVAVDARPGLLAKRGVRKAVKLAVSVPSHTPLMREAANRLAEHARLAWQQPSIPVVQNVDARIARIHRRDPRRAGAPAVPAGALDGVRAGSGRRRRTRMAECGPGKVLAGLAKRIDKSMDARTLATPVPNFDDARTAWA
jgi:[acyl-carrier-protein] S-malonyltransferase